MTYAGRDHLDHRADLDPPPVLGERLTPRDVPLGGPRATTVRRTLPQRKLSLIGPWCLIDHFGPDDVSTTGGMAMPRHPHTGLATVTLLFAGQILHRDSTGFTNTVRPGEVNLMTAGRGISHSEFSTPDTTHLHGAQLWYALPNDLRDGPRKLGITPPPRRSCPEAPCARTSGASQASVRRSTPGPPPTPPNSSSTPASTWTYRWTRAASTDSCSMPGRTPSRRRERTGPRPPARTELLPGGLHRLPTGLRSVRLYATSESSARVVVVGGPPFDEDIVMWWNFVGRIHTEIVAYRTQWQREIGAEAGPVPEPTRFGPRLSESSAALPAPTLPNAELRPRTRARGPQ